MRDLSIALASVIPVNDRVRARLLKDEDARKPFMPVLVADNLSWDDFARLNLDLPYFRGVQPEVGETRDYPYAEQFCACSRLCRARSRPRTS